MQQQCNNMHINIRLECLMCRSVQHNMHSAEVNQQHNNNDKNDDTKIEFEEQHQQQHSSSDTT